MFASDTMFFFRAWLAAPFRVAAVSPSSSALAKLMTQDITADTGPVIELGAGTGSFTRSLIARGVREQDLALVEYNENFAGLLKRRFPRARVLQIDAARLRETALFAEPTAGAVVCGMPLLTMPVPQVTAILDAAFSYLKPKAGFYQFTYGPVCPIRKRILDRLDLEAAYVGRTLRNLPPAAVYRIARRAEG